MRKQRKGKLNTRLSIVVSALIPALVFAVDASELDKSIDMVLLSTEPFPFKEKHKDEFHNKVNSTVEVKLVDGEYFSWYGSRLQNAFKYFKSIH